MIEEDPLPFQRLIIAPDLEVTLTYYKEHKGRTLKVRVQRPSDPHNTLRLLTYWIRPEESQPTENNPAMLVDLALESPGETGETGGFPLASSEQIKVKQTWEPMTDLD